MFRDTGLRKPEYPRDFAKLYSWSEDNFFDLFNAIKTKKFTGVRETAADIIILMSEIIEHAESVETLSELKTKTGEQNCEMARN
jgi:hypothetical protein